MASPLKLFAHADRVADFLAGRHVDPVTLELGLTTRCDRRCIDCPSGLGEGALSLEPGLVDELFAVAAGRIPGLILTGGEPTLHPHLPRVLAAAGRPGGFRDVAVITNGCGLVDEGVVEALVRHATSVRVSLYDWKERGLDALDEILGRVGRLAARARSVGSPLRVGVSALTDAPSVGLLDELAGRARDAGASWIYFHPFCVRSAAAPDAGGQEGVLAAIDRIRLTSGGGGFEVFALAERYEDVPLRFSGYHGARFVAVVGADARVYLSSETKYRPGFELADLRREGPSALVGPALARGAAAAASAAYPMVSVRSRGALYSDLLERLLLGSLSVDAARAACAGMAFVDGAIL